MKKRTSPANEFLSRKCRNYRKCKKNSNLKKFTSLANEFPLHRYSEKMDCTLKLALNFKYFLRDQYSPLYYAYKTEIEQFTVTLCCLRNYSKNTISLRYSC